MSISWTKAWSGSDDGTLFKGLDLANLQSDIAANIGNATAIQGFDIDVPVAGDDDALIFYDHGNSKFDYTLTPSITSIKLATGATVTGIADEDTMSSDSNTLLATQQSIKAYVDSLAHVETFLSNGTFTAPAGITKVYITMCGGGAGGVAGAESVSGGGGGGGHSIINFPYTVVPGNNYTVVVGAGGADTTDGNNSTFDTNVIAYKGSTGSGATGGAAGVSPVSKNGGNAVTSTPGAAGTSDGFLGGTGGNGDSSTGKAGGGGGASEFGDGVIGGAVGAVGIAAIANSGGGGSGGGSGSGAKVGGVGGSGICSVAY